MNLKNRGYNLRGVRDKGSKPYTLTPSVRDFLFVAAHTELYKRMIQDLAELRTPLFLDTPLP